MIQIWVIGPVFELSESTVATANKVLVSWIMYIGLLGLLGLCGEREVKQCACQLRRNMREYRLYIYEGSLIANSDPKGQRLCVFY
jgi:hypothetical protein